MWKTLITISQSPQWPLQIASFVESTFQAQRFLIYYHKWQRIAANPYIWEAGTSNHLTFFVWKTFNWLLKIVGNILYFLRSIYGLIISALHWHTLYTVLADCLWIKTFILTFKICIHSKCQPLQKAPSVQGTFAFALYCWTNVINRLVHWPATIQGRGFITNSNNSRSLKSLYTEHGLGLSCCFENRISEFVGDTHIAENVLVSAKKQLDANVFHVWKQMCTPHWSGITFHQVFFFSFFFSQFFPI